MAQKFEIQSWIAMKREYQPLPHLQAEYGRNKKIPAAYEEVVLRTLSHFPELRETHIEFRQVDEHPSEHSAETSVMKLLVPTAKRHYTVNILEKAESPLREALLKNLPYEAQVGAIAHELARITQFEACTSAKAVRLLVKGKDKERELTRKADVAVIEHGLGFELYTYATYIRRIQGYLELRKEVDINNLHPNEILEALPPAQLQEVHRF